MILEKCKKVLEENLKRETKELKFVKREELFEILQYIENRIANEINSDILNNLFDIDGLKIYSIYVNWNGGYYAFNRNFEFIVVYA